MNKIIKNLNLTECLFLDIETIRQNEIPPIELLQWQFRNRDTDEICTPQEAEASFLKKGALFPEMGRIICISLGIIKNNSIIIKTLQGDETSILKTFIKQLSAKKFILVGHNIKGFDLPYIRKRAIINELEYNPVQNDSGIKPWDLDNVVVDTMEHWKGSNYANTSLELLCYGLDIPTPKEGLRGSDVSKHYYAKGIDDIVKYCERDVLAVANVVRRWRGEKLLEVSTDEIHEQELGLIERIKAEGKLTPALYKELRVQLKGFNLKQREQTIDIVNAALILGGTELTEEQKNDILTYKLKT